MFTLQINDNAMTGTVCTLFELQHGDETKNQGEGLFDFITYEINIAM